MISVSLLLSAIESRPTKKTFLFAADIKMRKCIVDKNMYISRCEKRGIFFNDFIQTVKSKRWSKKKRNRRERNMTSTKGSSH